MGRSQVVLGSILLRPVVDPLGDARDTLGRPQGEPESIPDQSWADPRSTLGRPQVNQPGLDRRSIPSRSCVSPTGQCWVDPESTLGRPQVGPRSTAGGDPRPKLKVCDGSFHYQSCLLQGVSRKLVASFRDPAHSAISLLFLMIFPKAATSVDI